MQPLFTYFTDNSFVAFCTRLATYFAKKYYVHFCTFSQSFSVSGILLNISFLQKSNSVLSPDELEVVGILELQAFIEAKSVELGEVFIDEDLLCMVLQFGLIVEDQVSHSPGTKTGNDVGRGLSLLHLLNGWETLVLSFLMLTLSFLAVATTSSSVFSC